MSTNRNRYERWYDRLPTERDKNTVDAYATWLCGAAWQLYVTLTFACRVGDIRANARFKEFVNALERELRAPVGYVRGDEKRFSGCGKPASARHYHLLMTSTARLDPHRIEALWRRFGGSGDAQDAAKAEVVKDPHKAAEYCLKFINQIDGDWDLHNLDLFMPDLAVARRSHAAKRRAARHARRAVSQMAVPSLAPTLSPAPLYCSATF